MTPVCITNGCTVLYRFTTLVLRSPVKPSDSALKNVALVLLREITTTSALTSDWNFVGTPQEKFARPFTVVGQMPEVTKEFCGSTHSSSMAGLSAFAVGSSSDCRDRVLAAFAVLADSAAGVTLPSQTQASPVSTNRAPAGELQVSGMPVKSCRLSSDSNCKRRLVVARPR